MTRTTRLEPCPRCDRHVKVTEAVCPFCAGALAFAALTPRRWPRAPIGRAALFAFGVMAAPACGDDTSGVTDAATDAAVSADAPTDAAVDAAYDAAFDADPDEPDGSIAIYSSAPTTPPPPTPEEPNGSSTS